MPLGCRRRQISGGDPTRIDARRRRHWHTGSDGDPGYRSCVRHLQQRPQEINMIEMVDHALNYMIDYAQQTWLTIAS
ncbi:MAG: hypothetical protein R2710_01250 [Acidimicrobiales bacterium]